MKKEKSKIDLIEFFDKLPDGFVDGKEEIIYRFKTEQEFVNESGSNWRELTREYNSNWAPEMDVLFGLQIDISFAKIIETNAKDNHSSLIQSKNYEDILCFLKLKHGHFIKSIVERKKALNDIFINRNISFGILPYMITSETKT